MEWLIKYEIVVEADTEQEARETAEDDIKMHLSKPGRFEPSYVGRL